MTPHKFYNVTGEGAGGGEAKIPQDFKIWYLSESRKGTNSEAFKEWKRRGQELCYEVAYSEAYENASEAAFRHLSPSPGLRWQDLFDVRQAMGEIKADDLVRSEFKENDDFETGFFACIRRLNAILNSDASPSLRGEQDKKIACDAIWKAIEYFKDSFEEDGAPMGYAEIESELYDVMEQIDPSIKKGAPSEQDDDKWHPQSYAGQPSVETGEQVRCSKCGKTISSAPDITLGICYTCSHMEDAAYPSAETGEQVEGKEEPDGQSLIICPACGGDGKETCNNPDHGFIEAMAGEIGRLGCPVCGHDPNHKVNRGKNVCPLCGGHGNVCYDVAEDYARETGYDEEFVPYVATAPSVEADQQVPEEIERCICVNSIGDNSGCTHPRCDKYAHQPQVGRSQKEAVETNQPAGTTEDIVDFCQMLVRARINKGLSIIDAEDGAHLARGYLAQLEAGKYNQPSASVIYNLAKLYEVELKPLLIAGRLIINGKYAAPPKDEEIETVRLLIRECGKIPKPHDYLFNSVEGWNMAWELAFEKAAIAMYHKMTVSLEKQNVAILGHIYKRQELEHEIATLRSGGQSAGEQYRRELEEVKAERDGLHDLLEILNEGYSDQFTKFLNDKIYEALNKFTNNTKDE